MKRGTKRKWDETDETRRDETRKEKDSAVCTRLMAGVRFLGEVDACG